MTIPAKNQSLIILVVGASGAGKDTLLKEAKKELKDFNFIQRYITRKPDNNEQNHHISSKEFEDAKSDNFFISTWLAHGFYYGIAKEDIKNGVNCISVSRGAIKDFEANYENVITLHVNIPRAQLESRLIKRGRESINEIQKRLARSYKRIDAKNLVEFQNTKILGESIKDFINLLCSLSMQEENLC